MECACKLGELLALKRIRCVCGAGSQGAMQSLISGVLESGGEVTGVIPGFMCDEGWMYEGLTDVVITGTMHERKQRMAELADAVIALPGGCGTMEELLEIITWKQLGLFSNPIVVVNVKGYYDPLIEMLGRAIGENFMRPVHGDMWSVADTPEKALELAYTTPVWDRDVRKFAAI